MADMIVDVVEIGPRLGIDRRQLGRGELARHFLHVPDVAGEVPQPPAQAEDPPDAFGRRKADHRAFLHLLDRALERVEQRHVGVHQVVEQPVQHHVRPFGEPLRIGLELAAQFREAVGAAEAHRDDEAGAQEDRGLAVDDLLDALELGGAGQHEQLVAVSLGFRALVRAHRILDRERMEAVAALEQRELLAGRSGKADPVELAGARRKVRTGEVERGLDHFAARIALCRNDRHAEVLAERADAGNAGRTHDWPELQERLQCRR